MVNNLEQILKKDGFRADFKERLLKDLHNNNFVYPYNGEFFDSIGLQYILTDFLRLKLGSPTYLLDLDPVKFKCVTSRNLLQSTDKGETIGRFHFFENLIYVKSMGFVKFNTTFFHELGHYNSAVINSVSRVEEATAEFHRLYSDLSLYQLDHELGEFFIPDLVMTSWIPNKTYRHFFELENDYIAADLASIFALNHYGGDLEKTEIFMLTATATELSKIFFDALEKDPRATLREVYVREFREVLKKDTFKKSMIGDGYLTEPEFESFVKHLDLAISCRHMDLLNKGLYISENL